MQISKAEKVKPKGINKLEITFNNINSNVTFVKREGLLLTLCYISVIDR